MRIKYLSLLVSIFVFIILGASCSITRKQDVKNNNKLTYKNDVEKLIEETIIETVEELGWPKEDLMQHKYYSYSSQTTKICDDYKNTLVSTRAIEFWHDQQTPISSACAAMGSVKESRKLDFSEFEAKREVCYTKGKRCSSCSLGVYDSYSDYTMFKVGEYNFYVRINNGSSARICTSEILENSGDYAVILISNLKKKYKQGAWYK